MTKTEVSAPSMGVPRARVAGRANIGWVVSSTKYSDVSCLQIRTLFRCESVILHMKICPFLLRQV